MVKVKNPHNFEHIGFEKSHLRFKKYDAILRNKKTGGIKRIPFGAIKFTDVPWSQFKDNTGLGLYSKYNNYSTKARNRFRLRHFKAAKSKFSSGWFSWNFLW